MKEKEKELEGFQGEGKDQNVFEIEEITIEEMAIDGICGVY